ncbi:MAG: HD domain-containing protein [Proteobacteria bacterium]|nr:HD domain-containing protein [Pseudomonadota bacterium]
MKIFRRKGTYRIRIRLRTKFMIGIIIPACLLMSATIFVVENRMRESILNEFLKRSLSIANNLAAVNTNYVTTFDYVNIEQSLARAKGDNGLLYALVLLFDGEVAAYHGPSDIRQGILRGEIHEQALKSHSVLVQYADMENPEGRICDIAVPILFKGEKWGTLRMGFSLKQIQGAVLKTRKALFLLGLVALVTGLLGSILLARLITRPVDALVNSVEAVSKGDYSQSIPISTTDEIGYLSNRFLAMQDTLKEQIQALTDTNLVLTQTNKRLQSLFQASEAMNSLQNQEKLYDLILEAALMATDALAGSVTLLDQNNRAKRVAFANSKISKDHASRLLGECLLGEESFRRYHSHLLNPCVGPMLLQLGNVGGTVPFFNMGIESEPDLELLSIPLQQSGTLSGFISLIRKRTNGRAETSEMQTLSVLSSHATASLENRKLFLELETAYLSSIKSLAKTLELKDEYTHGHAERVAKICIRIAKRMDMDEKSQKVLHNAALLHDIGKIAVMESILNKASSLDSEEWEKIKQHPAFSEEILRPIYSLQEESRIVRHHHEREDGSGYPDGLYGNRLSLSEKIIIVADAYDAMNSKRAYRAPLDHAHIVEDLETNKGRQFDTEVVDVFLPILREESSTVASSPKAVHVLHFSKSGSSDHLREIKL